MRRAVYIAAVLALTSLTACTALVLGKLGDTKDFPLDEGGAGTSSSSSGGGDDTNGDGGPPACSIRVSDTNFNEQAPENACSQCIESLCSDEITYACADGGEFTKKDWFSTIATCAKHPYNGYAPPEAGTTGSDEIIYGCQPFVDAGVLNTGDPNSDSAQRQKAFVCVHDNCLTGDLPKCDQCVINVTKPNTNEIAYLDQDKCGKCFTDNCMTTVVACCQSQVTQYHLTKCAYTDDQGNLADCKRFGNPDELDASINGSLAFDNNSGIDSTCLNQMAACYTQYCKNTALYSCER